MKQQAIQYVALDVHQATLVVSVRDEQRSMWRTGNPACPSSRRPYRLGVFARLGKT